MSRCFATGPMPGGAASSGAADDLGPGSPPVRRKRCVRSSTGRPCSGSLARGLLTAAPGR